MCDCISSSYLVGDGGGYEIPRWLGESRWFEWPELDPGTSNVLWLVCGEFKLRFGKLWPKFIGCWTCNVFEVIFIFVGLFCGTFLPRKPPPPAPTIWFDVPSSLDNELVFSKSTETAFDSVNSTEPLNEKLDELMIKVNEKKGRETEGKKTPSQISITRCSTMRLKWITCDCYLNWISGCRLSY